MSNRNPRAAAPYAEHDIGHDIDGAAEVRLKVYATENPGVRPMMRFFVGRVLDFGGEQRCADEGHWTQTAPYLTDIDPLRLYEALVAQQKELGEFQRMWDDRKKKEQPPLSCFGFRDLMQTMQAPGAVSEIRAKATAVVPIVLEVIEEPEPEPAPKPKRAKKPKAEVSPAPEEDQGNPGVSPALWTPAEVMAYFLRKL